LKPLTDYQAWLSPRQARFWLVIAALVYTLAGFLLLPWLLQRELPGLAQDFLQRDAAVAQVRFNPWSLALEADALQLTELDGGELIRVGQLRVNLQVSSLFRRALVFHEVALIEPVINLVRDGFGDTNLGRLAADASGEPKSSQSPEEEAGLLRLVIAQLQIDAGRVDITDEMPDTPFNTQLTPINIQVSNLSTLPDDAGEEVIRINTEGDGFIEWVGSLQINPLVSSGQIQVNAPGLPLVTRYLDDVLDFDLDGGILDLTFDYNARALPDGLFEAKVNNLKLRISETALATEESGEDLLGFDQLQLNGGQVRWPDNKASIDEIILSGAHVDAWLNADGSLNLNQLLEAPAEAGVTEITEDAPITTPAIADAETEAPAAGANDWQFSIGRVRIENLAARFQDRSLPDQPQVAVRDVQLEVTDINNTPEARFPMELAATVDSGGQLTLNGTLGAFPAVVVETGLKIEALALAVAQPWLNPVVRVQLTGGTLSADTTLESSPDELLNLRGLATIDALAITNNDGEGLISWQQLAVEDLIFQLTANQVEIARLRLSNPAARVVINADLSTNFSGLIIEDTGASAATEAEPGTPLIFRMGSSFIESGSVDFSDLSLPLPFRTDIQEFGGKISALASDTAEPSELDFAGRVGEFGEAKITGELIALDPLQKSEVRVQFRNVSLPDLSPYTVDFAGRKLAAGKLNLDLNYALDQGNIVGKNNIVIDKIKLGEKVENPDALDLPLGLAVALLTDSNGVIDLKLNVEGDANDPSFSARGLVAKALANLLIKAVTSPFRLLGSLAGGDEEVDLQNIFFAPGEAKLSPPQEEKLAQLGSALAQRPGLQLAVTGAYTPELDRRGLQEARVQAAAEAEVEATDGSEELLAERAQEAFEKLARERLPDVSLRDLRAQFTRQDEDPDTPAFDTLAYLTQLKELLIAAEPVTEAELQTLGDRRAAAVTGYLAARGEFPADRILVQPATQVEAASDDDEPQVAMRLELDAG
jgi:outer membrane protein OmpA-like peptidoglycan-associated protein